MSTNERMIQAVSMTAKMQPRNEVITIYYGWHPDTDEVVVSITQGPATIEDSLPQLPESQWQTLNLGDSALVDRLFSGVSELRDIQTLISQKDSPSQRALLQYFHKIVGDALQ